MNTIAVIQDAYARLDILTPLKEDCGRLCQQACCQDQDELSGMYLFPGEEELLSSADYSIVPTTIALSSGQKIRLMICHSRCIRGERPLACRIFPLTPYVTPQGRLTTIVDPRAMSLCPLTQSSGLNRIQPKFIRAVEAVGQMLYKHEKMRDFLEIVSRTIDESLTF